MKILIRFVILTLALAILTPGFARCEGNISPGLEVYFLDLGRVDGILIRCDGETCFIDVGFRDDAKAATRFLQAMGIDRLDSYVGTHGHYDHIEGAPALIQTFRPGKIYISHLGTLSAMLECADDAQKQALSETERVILQPGNSFQIGGAHMTCLGPMTINQCPTGDTHENDNSLILRLDYGQRSMLFTGDIPDRVLREAEAQFPGRLNVDVLKNPHHNGSHDEDMLDMIQPKYVIFCTDDDNQPRQSYLELLSERGIRTMILGPANQGSVALLTDGNTIEERCGYSVQSISIETPPPMYVGQQLALTTTVASASVTAPDRQLGWNSSNDSVITAYKGTLTAIAPGTATVTAEAINGTSASVEVTVYDAVVYMDQAAMKLAVGETRRLTGGILPQGAQGVSGKWITTDPAVATVSGGKVTGVGEGTAQIIARLSNGCECACEVTVRGTLARAVRLDRSKVTLSVGDTLTLSAKVKPADYDLENLEWRSSDDGILWVDDYGNVTAVGRGTAKITVTASEGVTDVCTIKVK